MSLKQDILNKLHVVTGRMPINTDKLADRLLTFVDARHEEIAHALYTIHGEGLYPGSGTVLSTHRPDGIKRSIPMSWIAWTAPKPGWTPPDVDNTEPKTKPRKRVAAASNAQLEKIAELEAKLAKEKAHVDSLCLDLIDVQREKAELQDRFTKSCEQHARDLNDALAQVKDLLNQNERWKAVTERYRALSEGWRDLYNNKK